ncbi:MAG: hypothetical protein HZA95_03435 [Candidatus Vogelbacteria bacterium]|nr:hypothetical protein [Candidatus Vogelbacteria bacterium]
MKTAGIVVVVIVILAALGFWYKNQGDSTQNPEPAPISPTTETKDSDAALGGGSASGESSAPSETSSATAEDAAPATVKVNTQVIAEVAKNINASYSSGAFDVTSLALKVGDSLTFKNNSDAAIRVSSNPHPVHSEHPDMDSGMLQPGASWSYTFKVAGTYGFHNHLNPGAAGSVTVK